MAFAQARDSLSRLQAAAKAGRVQLYYLDGAGFACQPHVQRAWAKAGQPHQTDASVGRKRVNVLGALAYGDTPRLDYVLHASSIRSQEVEGFLDRLATQAGGENLTFVVLDNASVHHAIPAEKREEWLFRHKMILYFLPPYSPELNLIEIVWKQAKYHWRRFVSWTAAELKHQVQALLDGFGSKYTIGFA